MIKLIGRIQTEHLSELRAQLDAIGGSMVLDLGGLAGEPRCGPVPERMRVTRDSTVQLPGLQTQMDRQRAVASTARKD